ncbi:Nuclear control of ATPase protein 2 [Marasmius crinis-equi]|uniref:Nuclear control of ATPase protein 2 n=1 Tax=Marasmius crinis-equi TaxID=585013 RepID=A0ABR3FYM0_9AGAR
MAFLEPLTVRSYVKGLHQYAKKPLSHVAVSPSPSRTGQSQSISDNSESTKQRLQLVLASLDQVDSKESIKHTEDATQLLLSLNGQEFVEGLPSRKDSEQIALEQTVLNKVMISIYSQALDVLLFQSLEAEKEMEWWDEVERSPSSVAYYLLQTLPSRIVNLLQTIYAGLRRQNLPVNISQLKPSSLRLLFPSRALRPSVLLTSMFPHLLYSSQTLSPIPSSPFFFASQPPPSSSMFERIHHIISQFMRSIRHFVALPYYLTKQECQFKRRRLEVIRDDRALALGELAQGRLRIRDVLVKSRADPESFRGVIESISQAIDDGAAIETTSTLSMIRNLDSDAFARCRDLHAARLQSKQLIRPSRSTLIWPQLVLGPPVFLYAVSRLYQSRGSLIELAQESKEVLKGFLVDWIIEPLKGVLDTIRSKDRSVIVSKEGIDADFDSLERMAISLAKDHMNYSPEQLRALSEQVKAGDLTSVMKLYEEDIRSPLKSALTGTLLRTLFIQVQKAKVDIDQALGGIDRLLKSQELTFAFVGVAPALSLLYLTVGYLRRLWVGGRGKGQYGGKHQRAHVLFAMRRIERLLIHDQDRQVSSLTAGLLMLSVARLQSYAEKYLPKRSQLKQGFLEDVEDLEDPELGGNERRLVLERMWRSWGSVLGLGTIAGEFIVR